MKTLSFKLLAAGLVIPAVALAQPEDREGPPPGKGPRGERGFGKGWKEADANGDGVISLEEFANLPRIQKLDEERRSRIFNRLDKNGDKVLSKEELRPMHRPPNGEREAMMRFRELDTDNSGGVSLEELKAGELFRKLPPEKQEALFRRLDTDGDGQITVKDRPPGPPPGMEKRRERPERPGGPGEKPERPDRPDREGKPDKGRDPRRILRDLDTDGDGAVSFEEFRKAPPNAGLSEDEQEDRFEALDKNGDKKLDEADFPKPPKPPHGGPKPEGRPDAPPPPSPGGD